MIKMIDDEGEQIVTGYGYVNSHGEEETVELCDDVLVIKTDTEECVYIYKSDVDKLVKALTLAAKL